MLCKAAVSVCLLLALDGFALAQPAPSEGASPAVPPATAPSDSMEQPLVGDHWTYEIHDEITGALKFTTVNTVTDVSPADVTVRTENVGNPGFGYVIYDHSWNVKANAIWKYSPNDGSGVRSPLKAASRWTFQSNDTGHGVSFKRSGSSKVVGEESVTTNAGTFDTFKMETTADLRNVADPGKKFETITTTWYAPSIDHWVKRTSKTSINGHVEQNFSFNLLEYGRRQ
jgi:hypothetical protein